MDTKGRGKLVMHCLEGTCSHLRHLSAEERVPYYINNRGLCRMCYDIDMAPPEMRSVCAVCLTGHPKARMEDVAGDEESMYVCHDCIGTPQYRQLVATERRKKIYLMELE